MTNLLTVEGVTKRFGNRCVLENVGFSLRSGEVLGLIGPNGAGKTTLLECLSGLLPSDSGTIRFAGNSVPAARRKEHLFYLPDAILPWAEQTVEWALNFFAKLYRQSNQTASALVGPLRLKELMKARIASLSKGERKRMLLGLGLLVSHPLLLLDEPFDGLDLRQTREAMKLLREQVVGGRTLMLSIHQLTDAERVCDRLVLLNEGRVAGEGTIEELREQTKLSSGGLEEIFLALT